jgi:hypothetical protein
VRTVSRVGTEAVFACDDCEARCRNPRCDFCGKGKDQVGTLIESGLTDWLGQLSEPQDVFREKERVRTRRALDPNDFDEMGAAVARALRQHRGLFVAARAHICNHCVELCRAMLDDGKDDVGHFSV